jgi:integrase
VNVKSKTAKLTQAVIAKLAGPTGGQAWKGYADGEVDGLAVRVMKSGAKSYVLRYRHQGTARTYTIGDTKEWPLKEARAEARRLRQLIDQGHDPLAARNAERVAETVNDLIADWRKERAPHMRPRSLQHYEGLLRLFIVPDFGPRKAADLNQREITRWFHKIGARGTKPRANRALEMLSRLMRLAVRWKIRDDNPCFGIEKYPEEGRQRYLTHAELERLLGVLAVYPNRQIVRVLHLLLATGARFGEVAGARWDQFADELTVWTKPSTLTKQKKLHRVRLNTVATAILREIQAERDNGKVVRLNRSPFVFPATKGGDAGCITDIDFAWRRIREQAQLDDFHIHDLRHSFASLVISSGESLAVVGSLLGHSAPATTQRYAHLMDEAQGAATEKVGAILSGNGNGRH